jgi:hypothetical protein
VGHAASSAFRFWRILRTGSFARVPKLTPHRDDLIVGCWLAHLVEADLHAMAVEALQVCREQYRRWAGDSSHDSEIIAFDSACDHFVSVVLCGVTCARGVVAAATEGRTSFGIALHCVESTLEALAAFEALPWSRIPCDSNHRQRLETVSRQSTDEMQCALCDLASGMGDFNTAVHMCRELVKLRHHHWGSNAVQSCAAELQLGALLTQQGVTEDRQRAEVLWEQGRLIADRVLAVAQSRIDRDGGALSDDELVRWRQLASWATSFVEPIVS